MRVTKREWSESNFDWYVVAERRSQARTREVDVRF